MAAENDPLWGTLRLDDRLDPTVSRLDTVCRQGRPTPRSRTNTQFTPDDETISAVCFDNAGSFRTVLVVILFPVSDYTWFWEGGAFGAVRPLGRSRNDEGAFGWSLKGMKAADGSSSTLEKVRSQALGGLQWTASAISPGKNWVRPRGLEPPRD